MIWKILDVTRVIDGDTVELHIDRGFYDSSIIRFRLVDVDTPELRSSDPIEKINANLAKSFTQEWLTAHTPHGIVVESFKAGSTPDGGFGRWLGNVVCNSCNISLTDHLLSKDATWSSHF
jgi:micrococcal nuclease